MWDFPGGASGKSLAANEGDTRERGFTVLVEVLEEDDPLPVFPAWIIYLDGGESWRATVHRVLRVGHVRRLSTHMFLTSECVN